MSNRNGLTWFKLFIWSQMVLLISTLTLGAVYNAGLATNNVQLASLIEYPAFESATLFLYLVVGFTVLVVFNRVLITVRSKISKPKIDLELRQRLFNVGTQVKSMMKIYRPVKFFVGIRSY